MARDVAIEAVFKPVLAPTAFEETVERLGTAVRVGLLEPGSGLPPERQLADMLGISRTTLRQAITALVESGHLISRRGRSGGTFVCDEPPVAETAGADGSGQLVEEHLGEAAHAAIDHRVAIETGATLLAVERGTKAEFDALEPMVERMDEATDFEDYRRADTRFHIGIAEAAHSPQLVSEMTEVQGQMAELIATIPHPQAVLKASNGQHRQLVKLLRKRDATRAVRLMRRHIEGTEHILEGLLPRRPR